MDAHGVISSEPGVLGGTPVIEGTRVPVSALYDYLADGLTLDYFLETFPSATHEKAVEILGLSDDERRH